jgi:hypothetical protein
MAALYKLVIFCLWNTTHNYSGCAYMYYHIGYWCVV